MNSEIMVSDLNIGDPQRGTQPLAHSQHHTSAMKTVPILCSRGTAFQVSHGNTEPPPPNTRTRTRTHARS